MAVRLFVGNLPYSATEAALREHFSAIGPLSYIYLPLDRETGKPRGFAFVEFSERAQADEAIRKFNNQLFMGRPMAVNEAREREDRPQGAPSRPYTPNRELPELPGSTERPSAGRSFGPDAAPRRTFRKPGGRGGKGDRAPKQPIRERPGGRFFGEEVDESVEDDLMDDNFASRVDEADLEGEESGDRVENSEND
jgi:RNA recognition motif-containing protein